jgi:uroporphyrinogen III methyltransferase/synthase
VRILCPRADIAPPDLVDALGERGAIVREVAAYRTVPDGSRSGEVAELIKKGEIDWVTFTSSSTVRNFFGVIAPELVSASDVKVASIGPATSATLRELGFAPTIEADSHTIDGLVDAILSKEGPREVSS